MDVDFPSDEPGPCTITARKCAEGSYVQKDGVILEYRPDSAEPKSAPKKLKAPCDGVARFKNGTKRGEKITAGAPVCALTECVHAIVMKDMCATCGMNLREKDGRAGQRTVSTAASVPMIHNVPELVVSNELAKDYGDADRAHCLAARKLVLLVDLDQTVIHTTNRPPKFDPKKHPDICSFHLYRDTHWTKLRPYTRSFFANLSPLYEMHIVTFGQRQYAHKIAEIIDPEKKIFEHRILSRDEAFSQQHKTRNLAALFPSGEEMVAIIDDRPDVWEFSEALIQLRPYKYFPDVDDINAPPGAAREKQKSPAIGGKDSKAEESEETSSGDSKTEGDDKKSEEGDDKKNEEGDDKKKEKEKKNGDETKLPKDTDTALIHVEKVLRRVHAHFYKHYDETGNIRDLKIGISSLRTQVLKGCVIVLSGVVPVGVRQERSDAYRICVQFGARVVDRVDEQTTHVVAARWGTTKVQDASKMGVPIVMPEWLYACMEQWEKVSEQKYALTRSSENPIGAPLGSNIVPDLANIPTMGKDLLSDMANEVDEALSDDDPEDNGDDDEGNEDEDEEPVEEGTVVDKNDFRTITSKPLVASDTTTRESSDSAPSSRPIIQAKRKLCPEMRDRSYTGDSDRDADEDDDDVEEEDEFDFDYGDTSSSKRTKRGGLDEDKDREEEIERGDVVIGEDDDEDNMEQDYGDENEDEEGGDEDDDEFDDMAAELEHQLEQ